MTDLDLQELWLRYFALGGLHPPATLQSYLEGATGISAAEHDVAAHALNEFLEDHQLDHLVRYSADLRV